MSDKSVQAMEEAKQVLLDLARFLVAVAEQDDEAGCNKLHDLAGSLTVVAGSVPCSGPSITHANVSRMTIH